jgi:hypothetical protein
MMKKIAFIIAFFISITIQNYALDFDIGMFYGARTVSDSRIRDVYGNGNIYFPYLTIQ